MNAYTRPIAEFYPLSTPQSKRWGRIRRTTGLIAAISMLLLSTLACSISPEKVLASSPIPPGNVLFQDDFSDPNSSWDTWSDSNSVTSYDQGGLRIVVNQPHFDFWSRPGKRFDQAHLSVLTTKLAGPDNNDFGLICRFKNRDNFYAFLISSDGYGGILKVLNGVYTIISGPSLQYFEVIRQGEAQNVIEAVCNESMLQLMVNGEKVLEAQDGDLTTGEVGVIAGAYEVSGVDILFDDFKVMNP